MSESGWTSDGGSGSDRRSQSGSGSGSPQEGTRGPRVILADNAGLFALGGTRSYLVGRGRGVVVDPGPDSPGHLEKLASEVRIAGGGVILLTHRHPDHAAGAPAFSRITGWPVRAAPTEGWPAIREPGSRHEAGLAGELFADERISTDVDTVRVVPTPGHARDHAAFFLEERRILLAGDLLLGEGSTTWVGEYRGCVADYLASLDRIEALEPRRILPAHGAPLDEPMDAIARFRSHRLRRIEQVAEAVEALPSGLTPGSAEGEERGVVDRLVTEVYGESLPPALRVAAAWSIRAILEYLGVAPFPTERAPIEGGDHLASGA